MLKTVHYVVLGITLAACVASIFVTGRSIIVSREAMVLNDALLKKYDALDTLSDSTRELVDIMGVYVENHQNLSRLVRRTIAEVDQLREEVDRLKKERGRGSNITDPGYTPEPLGTDVPRDSEIPFNPLQPVREEKNE